MGCWTDLSERISHVPGPHHCSRGPGPNEFDMLTTLDNGVERGVARGALVAAHKTDG